MPISIKHKRLIFIIILVTFLVWLTTSYFEHGMFYSLFKSDTQGFIDYINSFGILSIVIFTIIVILEVVLAPIPPLILYLAAGILFGGFYGGLLVLAGNLIGSMIDFYIARYFFGKRLEKKSEFRLNEKFHKYFEKYGTIAIFFLRINPLTSSDLVSYLSGLTRIKPLKFLIATGLGLMPIIFLQTYIGDTIISENPILVGLTIFFSIIYMIIFVFLIIMAFKKKRDSIAKT